MVGMVGGASKQETGIQHCPRHHGNTVGQTEHPAPKGGNVGAGEVEWNQLDLRSADFPANPKTKKKILHLKTGLERAEKPRKG